MTFKAQFDDTQHKPLAWAGPNDERPPFSFLATTRVAFSDTDAQGIVYYGRYAPYFDFARLEYLRNLGLSLTGEQRQAARPRIEFVMRKSTIDYHAPAQFDDPLYIYTRVSHIGNSSMNFHYDVLGPDHRTTYVTSDQVMVMIDLDERVPVRISDEIRTRIIDFEGTLDS